MPADGVAQRKRTETAFAVFTVKHASSLPGAHALSLPGSAQVTEYEEGVLIVQSVTVVHNAYGFDALQVIFCKFHAHFGGFRIKGIPHQFRQRHQRFGLGEVLQMVFPDFNSYDFHVMIISRFTVGERV